MSTKVFDRAAIYFKIKFYRFIMKRTLSTEDASTSKKSKNDDFLEEIHNNRLKTADSIQQFKFNKKRLKFLNNLDEVVDTKTGIVYWMARDQRVQDNWALLFAQKLALKNKWPLYVVFCLTDSFLNSPLRHYKFMLDGLEEVSKDLKKLNINFHLLKGKHATEIPNFVKDFNIGCLVSDFSPLRIHREWTDKIKSKLPSSIPFVQVDAHNIIPVWVASDKQEYAARTIRPKITDKLSEYLTEFPPVIKHPYKAEKNGEAESIDWKEALDFVKPDPSVGEIKQFKPGYRNGIGMLESFIMKRLKKYDKRNDPLVDALSNLSPYFHFGQIAPQRAVIEVQKYRKSASEKVSAFVEEAVVRRELSDNFCYYNKNYDNLNGITDWARKTLNDHKKDKREFIYTLEELEKSRTHDDLWNSAQIQMVKEGKMHGFLRMYWAKKILEWTKSPEEALEFSIYLNDRYSIDGRDPNGYVGCMWSIGGVHDTAWTERDIFGKVRYMNYAGCKRKFKINDFIARYGGVAYNKKK
ncbi:hypothetical protein PVAND_007498 [Polypedilum vanderplanki]|uniref:Deoxyribodipyrimidine photo-lyase n=1 Tax=Polypedilum vanderplanki TaxID=319348 RepID=A0A9J6C736_POLVA|nr:hypothetical protein PVAND_007498 [Polypedilum vanderplanki]